MKFKDLRWRIIFRVLFMFIAVLAASYLIFSKQYIFLIAIIPVIVFQVIDSYRFHRKAQDELTQFVESVHYRDFSRNFDVKHAPVEVKPLRRGFNEINSTFKIISREKETQ